MERVDSNALVGTRNRKRVGVNALHLRTRARWGRRRGVVAEGALVAEVGAGGDREGGGVVGARGVEGLETGDDVLGEREILVADRLDDEF